MLDRARRLTGLLIALLLVAGLPLAAARASCVCDHGHEHGGEAAAAEGHEHGTNAATAAPHECTSACTAANCPMHRKAAAPAHHDQDRPAPGDGMRCSCAGEAQALVGQATVAGVLPALVSVGAPPLVRVSFLSVADAPLRLATTPPAPPPRA